MQVYGHRNIIIRLSVVNMTSEEVVGSIFHSDPLPCRLQLLSQKHNYPLMLCFISPAVRVLNALNFADMTC